MYIVIYRDVVQYWLVNRTMRSFVKYTVPVVCAGVLWWAAKEELFLSTDSKKEKCIALKALLETGAEKKGLEYQNVRMGNRVLPLFYVHGKPKGFDNCDEVSCYANSAVQCLFSLHDNLFKVLPKIRGPISDELEELAFSSLEKTESTKQLRKLFPSEYGFADSVRQCMTKFWETLFDCVDNENRQNSANPLTYRSPLTEIFHFENRKYLVCDICKWSEIEDDQTCRKLLNLTVPEYVESWRQIPWIRVLNPYLDRNCPNGHELTSQIVFTQTSPFLAVALNRNLSGVKNNASIVHFDFDRINLKVANDNSAKDSCYHDLLLSSVNYKAIAIAVHLNSFDVGHYIVYRRTPRGGWYRCNDSEVKEVDFNDFDTIDPYFVEKMTFLVLEKC